MQPPLVPIPQHLQSLYVKLRVTLGVILGITALGIIYSFLFPTIQTSFDFRNPKSSRNQIFDPRSENGAARTNGKIETRGTLIANTSPLGDFARLSVDIALEKRSLSPNQIEVSIRKNYRAFLYPIGEPIRNIPTADLYRIGTTVYELRDGSLHRFVSEAAFHSRYPSDAAREVSSEFLTRYPVAPDFLGFRLGSLISFADGVYVVTSDTEIRPIGSVEIFLALGYSFKDVLPVNEEDLGIYQRGRIMLMGAAHPDGTVFEEQPSGQLYLIASGMRHVVVNPEYQTFLRSQVHPITAIEAADHVVTRCDAHTGLIPGTLSCQIDLSSTTDTPPGPDYEITLSGSDTDIDISSIALTFETRLDMNNALTLGAKVKQRLLARFGIAQP
jgi:hypothetical protein